MLSDQQGIRPFCNLLPQLRLELADIGSEHAENLSSHSPCDRRSVHRGTAKRPGKDKSVQDAPICSAAPAVFAVFQKLLVLFQAMTLEDEPLIRKESSQRSAIQFYLPATRPSLRTSPNTSFRRFSLFPAHKRRVHLL